MLRVYLRTWWRPRIKCRTSTPWWGEASATSLRQSKRGKERKTIWVRFWTQRSVHHIWDSRGTNCLMSFDRVPFVEIPGRILLCEGTQKVTTQLLTERDASPPLILLLLFLLFHFVISFYPAIIYSKSQAASLLFSVPSHLLTFISPMCCLPIPKLDHY